MIFVKTEVFFAGNIYANSKLGENIMKVEEVIQTIINDVKEAKEHGAINIDSEKLISYLESVKEDSPKALSEDLHVEYNKARWGLYQEQYRAQNESNLEMFRSVIASGQNALRALFLINGGAVIAILAFLGNCYGKPKVFSCAGLPDALFCFTIGVGAIGVATALTYFTQRMYASDWKKRGNWLNAVVVIFGFISVASFCVGSWLAYNTFKNIV